MLSATKTRVRHKNMLNGYEDSAQAEPQRVLKKATSPLDDEWMGKPVRQHVKEFGAIFATIFLIVCASKIYHVAAAATCATWAAAALITALAGYRAPIVLLPLWRGWMKLAHYLSIVMTFLLLGIAWSIGFVPMAYLLKILRIKSIDLSYRCGAETYWEQRDPKYDDFKRLKQQF